MPPNSSLPRRCRDLALSPSQSCLDRLRYRNLPRTFFDLCLESWTSVAESMMATEWRRVVPSEAVLGLPQAGLRNFVMFLWTFDRTPIASEPPACQARG